MLTSLQALAAVKVRFPAGRREGRGRLWHVLGNPFIYIGLSLLVVAGLLVWQTWQQVQQFRAYHRDAAQTSVHGAVNEISILLDGLRRSVELFALEQQPTLVYLAAHPQDDVQYARTRAHLHTHFPDVFSFTIAGGDGRVLVEGFPNLVWDQCLTEIRHFAASGHPNPMRIHPHPDSYHFDVMVPLMLGDGEEGVFFVSFLPDRIAGILRHSQVPGHELLLTLRDLSARPLVELSADGARNVFDRNNFLEPSESARVDASSRIADTRWELVDLPDSGLYRDQWIASAVQSGLVFAVFLAVSLMVARLISNEERRRTRAEAALHDSYSTLNTLIEGLDAGVYLKDREGIYRTVNSAFARMAGKTTADVLGRQDKAVFGPELAAEFATADARVFAAGRALSSEEGSLERGRVCLVTRIPYRAGTGRTAGIIGIRQDITDWKRAQRTLRNHEQELAHVDRLSLLGELATGLAHELNQPLGAIVNYSEASLNLVAEEAFDRARLEAAVRHTLEQARRASDTIQRIRRFAEKGRRQMQCMEVSDVIHQALRFVRAEAGEKGVTVNFQAGDALPSVMGDPTCIEQVLVNLLINGMDAVMNMEPARRAVGLSLRLDEDDRIRVTVSDHGPGVQVQDVDRVFEPFLTTKEHGMGMGLAISRSIVEDHGGQLWVESSTPEGACFSFTLPVSRECQA